MQRDNRRGRCSDHQPGVGDCGGTVAKLRGGPYLVMAGQQPVEDGRERPYVPAISIVGALCPPIVIAGTSPAMTSRPATSFAPVTKNPAAGARQGEISHPEFIADFRRDTLTPAPTWT